MSLANASFISQKTIMDNTLEFDFSNPHTFHDYVVVVQGEKFYVNSGILSVWSEEFSNLFKKESTEVKRSTLQAGLQSLQIYAGPLRNLYKPKANVPMIEEMKKLEIANVNAEDFKNFLMVIYPVEFEVKAFNYRGLIDLAHRFLAPAVLFQCKKFIEKEFNNLDAFELLELAIQYDMEDIKDKVEQFLKNDPNILKCLKDGHSFAQHIFCAECNKDKLTYLAANRLRIEDLTLKAKAFVLAIICNI